jgi:1,2-diacylglycerol 3-alpha-glucosyltransferase
MGKVKLPAQLRICFIAFRFPILSRATDHGLLWPIAKGLAQLGHSVTVISAKSAIGKYEVQRDGVKAFYLYDGFPNDSHLPFEKAAYNKFSSLHEKEPFHIVHSIDRSAFRISRRRDFFKVAVAYDVEATQIAQIFSILGMTQESVKSLLATGLAVSYKFLTTYFGGDRKLLKSSDGIFVTNPQQRIFLERYYAYPDFHIYTAPYGIELGALGEHPADQELRRLYKIPETAKIALTVTDMTEAREITVLLRSFERVVVKKPNSYLIIIGNGPAWKEVEFNMLNLALGSKVLMLGALKPEDISDCISICDVYVNLSSRSTGLEPTMIEAMAQKKIIIGSEMSPISHIVEDGQDGFLIRPADHESLSTLLIEIFSGGIPASEIGERAKEKVINLFDPKKMVQTIEESYRKILSYSPYFSPSRRPPENLAPQNNG